MGQILNCKRKLINLSTYSVDDLSMFLKEVDIFVNFGFFRRAPVSILFQFNATRVGRYPSSLSASETRGET